MNRGVATAFLATWLAATVLSANTADRVKSPGNTAYYVDASDGADTNSGTSPESAWKSLDQLNSILFQPGDKILLRGSHAFKGNINIQKAESGSAEHPILISSYGEGRATIDAGTGHAITIIDSAYVHVSELTLCGSGRKKGNSKAGMLLTRCANVEIDNIDTSGFRVAGIDVQGGENIRITHANAHDNGFAGINASSDDKGERLRNLYIGYCQADNNPGDPTILNNHSGNGILVGRLNGALVEYCEASNNGWDMPRQGNGPVGIWCYECDKVVIQSCISHDNKSPGLDGGGFDLDGGVTHTTLQYNLSYNNAGCGYLLCQYAGAGHWKDNIVRYNISVHDGAKNHHGGISLWRDVGDIQDAQVYNNTIINSEHAVTSPEEVPGIVYRNNIFMSTGDVLSGKFSDSKFEHNLYWITGKGAIYHQGSSVYQTLEAWAKATKQELDGEKLTGLFGDPKLVMPEKDWMAPIDPQSLSEMKAYRLQNDSPCRNAGVSVDGSGGRDFFGSLLAKNRTSIGAHQP